MVELARNAIHRERMVEMPNWVYNTLTVTGDEHEIARMKKQLSRRIPRPVRDGDGTETVSGQWVAEDVEFSFWNITAPDESEWVDYFTVNKDNTLPYWYKWNTANWGCKWDAGVHEIVDIEKDSYTVTMETPWSPPIQAVQALSAQYPSLYVSLSYEEEQGWGGNSEFENGDTVVEEHYDEPSSHADYVARDMEDSCWCGYVDAGSFPDCPTREEEEN
jgi:hypothetical protein